MVSRLSRPRLVLGFIFAFVLTPAAHGQTFTWVSNATGSWSAAANWSGGTIPTSGTTTDLVFQSILDVPYVATNDIGTPFVTRSITINNQSSNTSPFGVQIVGPIQMSGTNAAIVDNGPGDLYLGPLSGAASTLDLASPTTLSGTNGGVIRITDQITGSGSLTINRPTTNLSNGYNLMFFQSATLVNTYSGGTTLQAGNLTFQGQARTNSTPANIGTGTLTIATTGSGLAATGDIRANASSTAPVIVTVPVTINNGATMEQNRGSGIIFGTPVNGAGGVSIGTVISAPLPAIGPAGLTFEGASNFSGRTDVTNTSLTLRGTTGALAGSTQIELFRNGALILDSNSINADTGNTAGNEINQNRIRDDATLTYHRADFNLIANATTSTTETVGALTGDGWVNFNLTPQTATGASLTVSNLVRSSRGTFDLRGAGLGNAVAGTANTSNVFLTQINGAAPATALVGGGGAAGSTNISIIPYMTGGTTAGSAGTSFVTYGANGVRPLTATEFATAFQTVPYLSGATDNVRTTTALVVGNQAVTANSFIAAGANAGIYGFGGLAGRVNVTSGAVLTTTATSYLSVGELNFAGREAVITGNGTTVINSAITNNTGLTYSGTARTALVSPNSVISGGISINSGTLAINGQSQLGGASAINLNGGGLSISNLGTATSDVLSTPINVGAAGGILNVIPVGGSTSSTSQSLTLTGALTGNGPLLINTTGSFINTFLNVGANGTVVLNGDASGYSGMLVVNAGTLQIDSDARLGTNASFALSSGANTSQPAALHVTSTTATNKNLYIGGAGFIQVDSGVVYTINGVVTSQVGSGSFRKMGPGELVLTTQATNGNTTFIGTPAMTGNINLTSGAAGTFSGVGGTLTLRDQGSLSYSIGITIAPGSSLVLDNTGSANLSNRIINVPVSLAGGSLVLKGSTTAASSEVAGAMTLAGNTGSIVEVIPGATQTAAMYFSGATNGGYVRTNLTGNGSTVTLRAPGLGGTAAGTGQINFISNPAGSGPALIGGAGAAGSSQVSILPAAFGEDSASGAFGLTTVDTVAAGPAFPQYYRTRLLNTTTEYAVNAFPDSVTVTTNHRQTAAAAPTGSPTVNSLFLDTGGSLTIGNGNTVTLTSGMMVMAGGTSVTGGLLAAAGDTDLSIYVGSGTSTLGSDIILSSSALPAINRTIAKTGPGTLSLTAPTTLLGVGTVAIQRGTFRLGTGGSVPAATNISVDAGATFDVNGTGATVAIGKLVGLGTVQLGSNAGTVLQVNVSTTAPMPVFGGTIAGTGSIEKAGAGTMEFGPTANYAGPITLTAGQVLFGDPSGFSPVIPVVAGSAITAADGTTISFVGVQDFQRPININVTASTGTVTLQGNQNNTSRISSPIALASGKTLAITTSASGLYNFTGAISGTGNVIWNAGNNIIASNNTYNGTTSIAAAATMGIGSDSAFGNGTVTVSAAASFFAAGANHTVSNAINLNSDISFGTSNPVYQGFDLTFAGPVALNANRTITTTAAGRLTVTNVSGATFNLIKAGGGTLALAGPSNSYSGTTSVNAGTLLVNGTLASGGGLVTVASGAFLGGNGIINRAVSLSSGGTIAPGLSPGPIAVNGDLTMSAGSVYLWELGSNTTAGPGTNWDQISMTSGNLAVAAGAKLIPSFLGTATQPNALDAFWLSSEHWNNIVDLSGAAANPSAATAFTIDNSAWSSVGSFSTVAATTGNGIALVWTPVPEPGSIALVLAATGVATGCRVIRRRAGKASV
jgi:fibronectin-binding autotransporter adhesin